MIYKGKKMTINNFIPHNTTGERVGLLQVRVGTYWAFREAQREHEDTDLALFRIIHERNHYKKWSYILAGATALACILAAVLVP